MRIKSPCISHFLHIFTRNLTISYKNQGKRFTSYENENLLQMHNYLMKGHCL